MSQPNVRTTGGRHHVVVIGTGFGGLFAAKRLAKMDVDVTVISRTTAHLFQPLLYQVATGILSEGEIAPAAREILAREKNVRVVLGDVTAIDLSAHTVSSQAAEQPTVTPYDSLIVAAGAHTSYFGHPEWSDFAPGLKSLDDALEVRGRILSAFEFAELATDPGEQQEWMTFVVVGAGATGVELSGQLSELSRRALPKQFRAIDTRKTRIVLVDAVDEVLGNFGTRLSAGAATRLQRLGVEVWLGEKVVGVDDTGVTVEDQSGTKTKIASRTVLWAAGITPSPLTQTLAEQSGAELAKGRVKVNPDCTLPGHPEVFVVGDMMTLNDYPGVAQVPMQQGKYAAKVINARLRGKAAPKPFHYFDKGNLATISRFNAVAQVGRFHFGGFVAWLLWLGVHVFYLIGFKNRFTTVLHWAISFLGRGRSQRTTSTTQWVGRMATEHAGIPDEASGAQAADQLQAAEAKAAPATTPSPDTSSAEPRSSATPGTQRTEAPSPVRASAR